MHEFRLCYSEFMVTRDPEVDRERSHILGAWTTVPRELLLREELELRGISYGSLLYIYHTLGMPSLIVPPAPPLLKEHHL